MSREQQRRTEQLALLGSDRDIDVHTPEACPLPVAQLAGTQGDEAYVREQYRNGLTAQVFHLQAGGRDWTLKRQRADILVKNVDGQTSFLNEVQRRADFTALKRDISTRERFGAVVDTQYASLRQGIILSPWIDGQPVSDWDQRRLQQLFDAMAELLLAGFFEWDFCSGNILDDSTQLHLFDFGYMYRFDPRTEFNSNGLDTPLFHGAERFETRNYFAYLLRLEREQGMPAALRAFRLEKEIALVTYERLVRELEGRRARKPVLDWLTRFIRRWQRALAIDIDGLYLCEGWRSHALDLHDDLSGQSCTPTTLARADWLLDALKQRYRDLKAGEAFFFDDEGQTAGELLTRYEARRRQAVKYQLPA